jgi:glycosyltransferase involved in cell wall biosynthesis
VRIVFVQVWHGEKMGYVDRFLPRAMAALGHDVHLVTSNVQPYFDLPSYRETYQPQFGPPIVPCGIRQRDDGVWLHRLPHGTFRGRLRIRGLFAKLRALRPDIVQGFEVNCITTYEAALYQACLGYELFLEAHIHASVFPPATRVLARGPRWRWEWYKATLGQLVSARTRKCYPISTDAADIATRFFGMPPRKVQIEPLGTDTALFRPPQGPTEQRVRHELRARLGFSTADIVCIYTGRITRDKGPTVLAEAIARLVAAGDPFRGLFVGQGPAELTHSIARCPGCVLHPFVPVDDLPPLYQAADVAVWPKQESTSQLDAAACGLPLILSDCVQVRERIEGNGLTYRDGDGANLAAQLGRLKDAEIRRRMGAVGRKRMVEHFDWRLLAARRLTDYAAALAQRAPSAKAPKVRMRIAALSSSERCLT